MPRKIAVLLAATWISLASVVQAQTSDIGSPLGELSLGLKSLTDLKLDISDVAVSNKMRPTDMSKELFSPTVTDPLGMRNGWPSVEFNWAAANVYHQPLYFDDTPLERYGQTRHWALQPWISGARFFMTVPAVPYLIGIDRPYDHIYTLGYYWPGSPTPCLRQRLPFELDAAALESGAWIALILLLP